MRWPFWKAGSFFPANAIAVELGSANTLIYVKGEGIVLNEPSVVALDRETRKIKGVGLEAKRMLGRTPEGIIAVRPMKDGVIADFDVTEKMLRYFLALIIENHFFKVKPRVIVCVPSGITEVEKRAVRDSALGAGAKEVFMVAEPMAAAIGVGLPVETPTGNMVIDIGGGTTEIAVIALSGIVSDTSIRTGGDELDQAIVQFMRKNYNLLIGEPTAEQIKIQIGSAAPVGEEREMEVKGRDLVSGIPKIVRVHSSEIREAVQEPIQQIVGAAPVGAGTPARAPAEDRAALRLARALRRRRRAPGFGRARCHFPHRATQREPATPGPAGPRAPPRIGLRPRRGVASGGADQRPHLPHLGGAPAGGEAARGGGEPGGARGAGEQRGRPDQRGGHVGASRVSCQRHGRGRQRVRHRRAPRHRRTARLAARSARGRLPPARS